MDITNILEAAIYLIGALVSVFLIPYLKTKLNEAQRKRIKQYIDTAVMAAEKLYPSKDGEKLGTKRLAYVSEYLAKKGIYFDVNNTYDDIRVMIESAVNEFTY